MDADVFHYRDNTGLEIDAIVATRAGEWAAFEVRLGGEPAIESGVASLRKFRDRVDSSRSGEPVALGVIVGAGAYAFRREDGIWVVPVGVLGP